MLLLIEFPYTLKPTSLFKSNFAYSHSGDVLFKPLNALLLPDTTKTFIPFVDGWVTDEKDQSGNYLTKNFKKDRYIQNRWRRKDLRENNSNRCNIRICLFYLL